MNEIINEVKKRMEKYKEDLMIANKKLMKL